MDGVEVLQRCRFLSFPSLHTLARGLTELGIFHVYDIPQHDAVMQGYLIGKFSDAPHDRREESQPRISWAVCPHSTPFPTTPFYHFLH